ncbi:hypothetical protein PVAP13_1NG239838 [Panicum virgatum]|uniref:CBM1 domain-containing protein n=1 Tax=Panicum virgatum TaxID=38727 RepID=A0A8T0X8D0_PANVG|nr:hypothetical protein PVAP13_1NG239838 [Panicum virgatum]
MATTTGLERKPRRETPSPPASPVPRPRSRGARKRNPSKVRGERNWMGAWVLWGGGSRNGGGKLERGGVSEPKPRAPAPAPAQRALAFGIQGGGGRVPGAGGGRRGAARVRLGVWPCAGDAWRGPAACVIGSTCKKKNRSAPGGERNRPRLRSCSTARVRLLRADSTGWCTEGSWTGCRLDGLVN